MNVKNPFNRAAFCEALEESPHSVTKIARLVGCRTSELYRYKNGQAVPQHPRLIKLVEVLGPTITNLKLSGSAEVPFRFTTEQQEHLRRFKSWPPYVQAKMLSAETALFEFGPDADVEFAAAFGESLNLEEQQQKEQPG